MEQELISSVRFWGVATLFVVALVLALSKRGKARFAVYNTSRTLLIMGSLLLAAHFLIQYLYHLREQSVTLCWALNLSCFVIVTPLYNMAELNLMRAGHNMKRTYWHNALFIALCYILLVIGYFTRTLINDLQPWMTMTFIVALLYSAKLIELSWVLSKEMREANTLLTAAEQAERSIALQYTARSMHWVILLSLATPWVGMSSSLVLNSVFGTVIFFLIVWFLLSFLGYGDNLARLNVLSKGGAIPASEKVAITASEEKAASGAVEAETPADDDPMPTSEAGNPPEDLKQCVELWISQRRYADPSLTISEALNEMGISAKQLNVYLHLYTDVPNYRSWLQMLRVEEAKRVMLAHPEYSLQAVANACGYANSGNLSRAFKGQEGIAPSEWVQGILRDIKGY